MRPKLQPARVFKNVTSKSAVQNDGPQSIHDASLVCFSGGVLEKAVVTDSELSSAGVGSWGGTMEGTASEVKTFESDRGMAFHASFS